MNIEMHIPWGSLSALAGLLLLIGGTKKREFVLYRLHATRSRLCGAAACTDPTWCPDYWLSCEAA